MRACPALRWAEHRSLVQPAHAARHGARNAGDGADARYINTPAGRKHLVKSSREYVGALLLVNHNRCDHSPQDHHGLAAACLSRFPQRCPRPPSGLAPPPWCRSYWQFGYLEHALRHGELPAGLEEAPAPAAAAAPAQGPQPAGGAAAAAAASAASHPSLPGIQHVFGSNAPEAEVFALGMTGAWGPPSGPPLTRLPRLQRRCPHPQPPRPARPAPAGASIAPFQALSERFGFERFSSLGDFGGSLGTLSACVARQHSHMRCVT